MKVLLGILTIYFLALSTVPCQDTENSVATLVRSSLQHSQDAATDEAHTHSGNHRDDECSPFCSCHCCSISIVTFRLFESGIGKTTTFAIKRVLAYQSIERVDNYPNIIWQPPKSNA